VNIPIQGILKITDNFLQITDIDTISKSQILQLMKTVLYQNYFIFSCNIYKTRKGIAMGSPVSGIIAEILLQHYENIFLETKKLICYTRYVDYIFIIYNKTMFNPDSLNQLYKRSAQKYRF
jgi:hypothetical protein